MDRQEQIEILLDHYENPRHRYTAEDPHVLMPGGNPGCGDVVTIYLTVDTDDRSIKDVSWDGEGCTISQAAASILMEMVHDEQWTLDDVIGTDHNLMIDVLGKEVVQTRPRCATLALGTMKAAVRKYRRDRMIEDAGLGPAADEEFGIVTGDGALQESQE